MLLVARRHNMSFHAAKLIFIQLIPTLKSMKKKWEIPLITSAIKEDHVCGLRPGLVNLPPGQPEKALETYLQTVI